MYTNIKISYEKTTVYRLGSLKDSDAEFYTQKNLKWSSGPIETLVNGHLNPTGRHILINLIPKKHKNELELRHWRPISILNNDFKIWSKSIANRLEEATYLIGKEQTGFIKGRSIFSNVKKTMEIVSHLNKANKPGVVVIIDFEKCFDQIEYRAIEGVFKFFGFGTKFIEMMFLLFNDLVMRTQCNGYTSNYFKKTRGVNQGCCASPLIYSYCSAVIQHVVYANDSIQGIELFGIKNLLSQFADDTAAFLTYSRLVLEEFTKELLHIETLMGLKISYEKTTVYRLGSLKDSDAEFYTQKNLKWSSGPIETLGVKINADGTINDTNFTEIITKLKTVCGKWINRQQTLFGKTL